jgi:hypothetical protein
MGAVDSYRPCGGGGERRGGRGECKRTQLCGLWGFFVKHLADCDEGMLGVVDLYDGVTGHNCSPPSIWGGDYYMLRRVGESTTYLGRRWGRIVRPIVAFSGVYYTILYYTILYYSKYIYLYLLKNDDCVQCL